MVGLRRMNLLVDLVLGILIYSSWLKEEFCPLK